MISRLVDRIVDTGAPIVVGLDPKLSFIPDRIKNKAFEEKGVSLEGAAEAFCVCIPITPAIIATQRSIARMRSER